MPANPAAQEVAAAALKASTAPPNGAAAAGAGGDDANADEDDDAEVCFICANPVAHYSIAPCNHQTCHICGLRMRALYKTKDCAHCRTSAPFVIFTDDAERRFEDYSGADITTADSNIGIKYTNEDIVGDTILLLRYNCPDPACDFAGLGWPDLHRHVKSAHRKRMCDLCTRNKKVFTHEHELFTDRELERHMRHGDDKPGAADQTGFKGHPLCGFCGERFYDDDRLYEHCRMKHERCFLCDRRDSRHPHYYLNYDALEEHFRKDHYLCKDGECLEKKFVVFESELDLQAHNLSDHAGKAVGRDARLVDMSGFDIRPSYQQERRGGGDGSEGRTRARGGRGRGRGRDPNNDEFVPARVTQNLRRDEVAYQRQMAIQSAQSVSNRTFGGQLTAPTPSAAAAQGSTSRGASAPSTPRVTATPGNASPAAAAAHDTLSDPMDALSLTDMSRLSAEERARVVRHGSVVERAANLLGHEPRKMAAFREHVSSYRRGALPAPQLVDSFFTLFADASSNALGTLVREVADLFEDRAKADALRAAWQDWRSINEDYPSLPGLSGMHGATSSSSGWASAATVNPAAPTAAPSQQHSTRVLRLKNSTRLGGPAPVPPRAAGWNSPAAQASSSSAFPSLPSGTGPSKSSSSSAAARPSWLNAVSTSSGPSNRNTTSTTTNSSSISSSRGRGGREDAFPALPAAPKPTTTIFGYGTGRGVRRDFGVRDSGFQWGGGGSSSTPASGTPAAEDAAGDAAGAGAGSGKKGKKGKKQVLVQWG